MKDTSRPPRRVGALLEAVSNALFIAVVLVFAAVFTVRLIGPHPAQRSRPAEGEVVAALPGLLDSSHERTLILALKRGCSACESSFPLYQQIQAAVDRGELTADVVAALPDDSVASREYLEAGGVRLRTVANVTLQRLGVHETPTILLVARDGRLLKTWTGVLSADDKQQLLQAVTTKKQ